MKSMPLLGGRSEELDLLPERGMFFAGKCCIIRLIQYNTF